MHKTCQVTVRSPTDVFCFQAECNIRLMEVLALLTGDAMPSTIFLMPGESFEAKVHLPLHFLTGDDDTFLYAEVPSALCIRASAFAMSEHSAGCILVLSSRGLFALKRESGMNVADVLLTLNHSLGVRSTCLTGVLGERHESDAICPNIVVARDYDTASGYPC